MKISRAHKINPRGIQVFRLKVVEAATGHDHFTGNTHPRRTNTRVLQNSALQLTSDNSLLHKQALILREGTLHRRVKLTPVGHLRHSHRRPGPRWFDKDRQAEPGHTSHPCVSSPQSLGGPRPHPETGPPSPGALVVPGAAGASGPPAPPGKSASCQLRHTVRRRATQGATAIPAATNIVFVTCLSIPTAEASTPFPTYGRPSNSSIPWIVPSSPNRPCRIGKTTSTSPSDRSPVASCTRSSRLPTEVGHTIRVPLSMTSGMRAGSSANRDGSSAASTYPPSRVIPIGMTRNCSRSRALRIPPAVAKLIECSLDRPPKRSATVRIICCPFAPGHTVGHKLGGEIPRCQGAREYLSHLFNNGHRHTLRPRKFQNRTHRCQSLRGLSHLVDNVAESVPLPQQATRRVVSR